MEEVAEVIDGFLAVGGVVNDGGDFEPEEVAFVVVVGAAVPVEPAAAAAASAADGLAAGGVKKRTPGAAGTAGAERSGDAGEKFAILLGGPEAAARGEHGAEVVGEAFIAPEEIGLHRLFEVGSGEVGGAAELAVPGVDELMREQAADGEGAAGREEDALGEAAVVRLVMLEAEVRDVIAEREQEVVVAVVARAEEHAGFSDDVGESFLDGGRDGEGGFAVGDEVELVVDGLAGRRQVDDAVVTGLRSRANRRGDRRRWA